MTARAGWTSSRLRRGGCRIAALVPIPAICLAACSDPGSSAPNAVSRDSAGVRIVHSSAPSLDADAWTVSDAPIFQVGAADGADDYWFGELMGMARLWDGTVVAADMRRSRLAFYGRDGRFIRAVGRKGQGPGEHQQIMNLHHLPGDSLLVEDFNGFAQLFDPRGSFVRRISLASEGERMAIMRARRLVGPFGDGTFAATAGGFAIGPNGPPDSRPVYRVAPDGAVEDSIVSYPTGMRMGPRGPVQVVFAGRDQLAAAGGRLYHAYASLYRVEIRDRDGRLTHVVTREWTPAPIREEELQAYRESYIGMQGEDGRQVPERLRAQRARILEESPVADHHPPFLRMLVDRGGNFWLQERELAHQLPPGAFQPTVNATSRWSVFDSAGVWLTDVTLPANFRVFEISEDYLLGLSRDEQEVEQVRVYALRKR